jgi:hypothetical protein
MTDNHPITVPTGSITCWRALYRETYQGDLSETEYIANEAARWGADQELEACCEWIPKYLPWDVDQLRAARRPKRPSLKEQAQRILVENGTTLDGQMELDPDDIAILRRALENVND